MFILILGWLHAALSSFDVNTSDCLDCKEGLNGLKVTSLCRRTCRQCVCRDAALRNVTVRVLCDSFRTPTLWGRSAIELLFGETGKYLGSAASEGFRNKGQDYIGLFPKLNTASSSSLERELRDAISSSEGSWRGISLPDYLIGSDASSDGSKTDPKCYDTNGILSAYISTIGLDDEIQPSDLISMLEKLRTCGPTLDGFPFFLVDEQLDTRILLGKRKVMPTALAVAKIADFKSSEERHNGDEQLSSLLKTVSETIKVNDIGVSTQDSIKGYVLKPSFCSEYPHYNELWFTRALCCPSSNDWVVESTSIKCPLHSMKVEGEENLATVVNQDYCSLSYGLSRTAIGTLCLPGLPEMHPSTRADWLKRYADNSISAVASYVATGCNTVQRKLGVLSISVMDTLLAVWGNTDKIPQERIDACAGLPEREAIATALLRSGRVPNGKAQRPKASMDKTDELSSEIQELKRLILGKDAKTKTKAKTSTSSNASTGKAKGDSKKSVHKYKHKDAKTFSRVCSRFGTSDFKLIMKKIKAELGEGKFDPAKLCDFWNGGSFSTKSGDHAKAMKFKEN